MYASILPFAHKLGRFAWRKGDPVDVLAGIQADIRQNAGEEDMLGRPTRCHGDGLPLEVADRADVVGSEQLEAADVETRKDHDSDLPRRCSAMKGPTNVLTMSAFAAEPRA